MQQGPDGRFAGKAADGKNRRMTEEMLVVRDDPQRPSLVITDPEAFRKGLDEAVAAMDEAVAEAERQEALFPMLRVVREARATHIRVRHMMYERRRDAAMRARIERRLQAERDRRAEQEGARQ